MEKISLITMMISAAVFIVTALVFSEKKQLKGYIYSRLRNCWGYGLMLMLNPEFLVSSSGVLGEYGS